MPGAATNGHPARSRPTELLRIATAGSVDDGKSTLIGRLLYDSKQVLTDQLEHVIETSERRGDGYLNLALLTDGLRAEREQGITIDVAYRYFQTKRRKFIIADTPGHEQYTRNMVTGASTADLSVILVDARKGVSEQTRRHAHIASLLRIPHLVVCVNKMDLVDWDEAVFERIEDELTDWAARLDVWDITFIPISALHGDNVVERSANMSWYDGPPLLYHLEHVVIATDRNLVDLRFPVQWVIRVGGPQSSEHHGYRGYAGQVAAGVLRAGDEVMVLPGGQRTRIAGIDTYDGEIDAAFPTMSVTLRLADDLDVSRGDMVVNPDDPPVGGRELDAMVCWMSSRPMQPGARYALKHTTRTVRAVVEHLEYQVDVNSLEHEESPELQLNEIGRVRLRTSAPVMVDRYRRNRTIGSFILIDEATNDTVGAGMIVHASSS
jgi:bifunctional enzyme CysN/CysC